MFAKSISCVAGKSSDGRILLIALAFCMILLRAGVVCAVGGAARGDDDRSGRSVESAEIDRLVQQLGSDHFIRREQARVRLQSLGQEAFDSLYAAKQHRDTEIRLQAERLLQAISVDLSSVDDSPEVKQEIERYRTVSNEAKLDVIQRLGALANDIGRPALCRIARYENSEWLSKQAALAVLDSERPVGSDRSFRLQQIIEREIGQSRRPAAVWLRTYQAYLDDAGPTYEKWVALRRQEEQKYLESRHEKEKEILKGLTDWQLFVARQLKKPDEPTVTFRQLASLFTEQTNDTIEFFDWLIRYQEWEVLDVIATQQEEVIRDHALLSYQLASSLRRRGDAKKADELRDRAFSLTTDPLTRMIVGRQLLARAEIDWFEKEFRAAIDDEKSGLFEDIDARYTLLSVKLDWEQYEECVAIVEEIVENVQSDEELFKRLQDTDWFSRLRSKRDLAESYLYQSKGEFKKQRELLKKAWEEDDSNIDILITLYHLPNQTPEEKREIEQLIARTVQNYEAMIDQLSSQFRRNGFGSQREDLAANYNEYAWLVSNTFGDFEQALEYSKESLELSPNSPGYLDTTARCYFALKRYEPAVILQRAAARQSLGVGQVQRQLELFEKTYAEQLAKQP